MPDRRSVRQSAGNEPGGNIIGAKISSCRSVLVPILQTLLFGNGPLFFDFSFIDVLLLGDRYSKEYLVPFKPPAKCKSVTLDITPARINQGFVL